MMQVDKELIRWALQRSGQTAESLAGRFPKIREWESGDAQPTLRQLESLAKKTWTPLGYFFLPKPPAEKLPIPDFRTKDDAPVRRPSPNLIETLHSMQRRQSWLQEFLKDEGHEPLSFVGSASIREDPNAVAGRIRKTMGMDSGWASRHDSWSDALRAFRETSESLGILVVINGVVGNSNGRKLDTEEFQGFVLTDALAPLVFVNGADYRSAQMFTLAHEIAHLWIGQAGLFRLPHMQPSHHAVEQFCNQVAAEVLVPAVELKSAWPHEREDAEPFQALARRFRVSAIVAARRALDLGLIDRARFFEFWDAYLIDERRRKGSSTGGNFYLTQNVRVGRRFARIVARAAREDRLLYRDAYHLTGLNGATFDRYMKHVGA